MIYHTELLISSILGGGVVSGCGHVLRETTGMDIVTQSSSPCTSPSCSSSGSWYSWSLSPSCIASSSPSPSSRCCLASCCAMLTASEFGLMESLRILRGGRGVSGDMWAVSCGRSLGLSSCSLVIHCLRSSLVLVTNR